MNKIKSISLNLLVVFILYACNSNLLDVKLNNAPVSIEFINVDKQLGDSSIDVVKTKIELLKSQLGNLFLFELAHNIRENINDSSYHLVYDFYQSEYISNLEKEKEKIYQKLPEHQKNMNLAFQYLSFHFGDSILPKQIFYINMLFSQITCSKKNIAVGLENYISPNSPVIQLIPGSELYQWQRDRMDIQFLERDVLLAWIQVNLFEELDGKLAEHIVQAGKVMYILNAVFPKADESYILRYSKSSYDWAVENESLVWNYLVQQQLLFKTDMGIRVNFLNEGPTTVGLPDESPDRMGQFLGYQMVKGFMHKHKTLSLQGLLDTKYNIILQSYEID